MKNIQAPLIITSGFIFAYAFTHTFTVALAFMAFVASLYFLGGYKNAKRTRSEFARHLPEVIDHLISGIQSGLSLAESLTSLATRGPEAYKPIFSDFQIHIQQGMSFEEALSDSQERIGQRSADQLFESLLFARELGGTELVSLLRQLATFIRSDIALREEIEAKQSWVRNSAHLSAAAPWILLILLSTQESTSQAYSSFSGMVILGIGLCMTCTAYIWMGFLARIPQPARIFGDRR